MESIQRPIKHDKGWGYELWIANSPLYCGKVLVFNAGKACSMHFHLLKHETFFLESGRISVEILEDGVLSTRHMEPGDSMEIPPGTMHRIWATEASRLFEFSTQHFETDSYRIARGD
jgi:mannose-6-phosphate isomerase-like protein (cupin superfamily)